MNDFELTVHDLYWLFIDASKYFLLDHHCKNHKQNLPISSQMVELTELPVSCCRDGSESLWFVFSTKGSKNHESDSMTVPWYFSIQLT